MENRLPMSIQELTSGPTAEPVDFALLYATCLQAAATYLSGTMTQPPATIREIYDYAGFMFDKAIKAGDEAWKAGAVTLTPGPKPEATLARWTELLDAAELVVVGTKYGDRTMHRSLDRLHDAVAALREGNPRIDPS